MLAKDKVRTGTIRMLLAAIMEEETKGAKHEVTDQEALAVVAREIKRRRESAEVYSANGREDLAEQELKEAAVLEDYQPEQLDDAALEELVRGAVAEVAGGETPAMKHMGAVMRVAKERAAGQVDGRRLSDAVKAALNG